MNKLNLKLTLKESKITSIYELFHKTVENLVLFKWIFFKNRPRSSFLLLRSFLVNTVVFSAYYVVFSNINFIFMGVEIEPLLLFAGSVSVSYWVMSWSFSQKANYLSSLYNDIIKHQAMDSEVWRILACSFSAQLLTMDLWGHRLYSWIFTRMLQESADWYIKNNQSEYSSLDEFIEATNKGQLEVGLARQMVLCYQQHLTEMIEQRTTRKAS